ncbi:hypothetical protein ACVWYU_001730 [Pseudomonas sp. TE12234]
MEVMIVDTTGVTIVAMTMIEGMTAGMIGVTMISDMSVIAIVRIGTTDLS